MMKKKREKSSVFVKTRMAMSRVVGIIQGKTQLDPQQMDALKKQLLLADVGWDVSHHIITHLQQTLAAGTSDSGDLLLSLKQYLRELFVMKELVFGHQPEVVLIIGVNGVGKTTTIGKLAKHYQGLGKQVAVASGDTYRAAANEQLAHWAKEAGASYIDPGLTKDPAAVMYDSYTVAQAQGIDVLLADTAGRMHGNENLSQQLQKMVRVLRKKDDTAPHHIWLVLDASLGQNSLEQAKIFHESVGLTGLIITKLDGTAKGGQLFSIVSDLRLPVHFIGIGEGIGDLASFDPDEFIDEVLSG